MQRLKELLAKNNGGQYTLTAAELKVVTENVERLVSMNPATFTTILSKTHDEKEASDQDAVIDASMPMGDIGVISVPVSRGNILKEVSRLKLFVALLEKAAENKLDVLDALHQCLTAQFGQHGPNSFKYMLLRNLCALDATPAYPVACATVEAYIKVVQAKKDEVAALRYAYAQGKLEAVGVIQSATLARTLRKLLNMKDVATESKYDSKAGALSAVQKFVVDIKNGQRRKQIETLLTSLDKGELSALEALHQCLTLAIGNKNEHSFKYYVVSELFKLSLEDAKHACELVDCFIEIIKQQLDSIKSPLQVRVEKMVVSYIPPESKLFGILGYLGDPDNYADAKSDTSEQDVLQSAFGFFQSQYRQQKEKVRSELITPIFNNLRDKKITDLDALYQLLKMSVGQQGPHSFKYKLLVHLFGRKDDSAKEALCLEATDAESASKIINCFIAVLDKKLEQKKRADNPVSELKELQEPDYPASDDFVYDANLSDPEETSDEARRLGM